MGARGKVTAITEVRTFLLTFVDGRGEEYTRLAVVGPKGGVLLFAEAAVDKPVQKWLKQRIADELGISNG